MNVHLIRAKGLSIGRFNNICNYLNQFKGDIQFNSIIEEEPDNEEEEIKANIDLFKRTLDNYEPLNKNAWKPFFEICETYRAENKIAEKELIILLTNERNDNNYFGYVSDDMKNVFIQVSEWKNILGDELDETLPVVYEIAAWTLRFLLFTHIGEMKTRIPPITSGCLMDMCKNKEDISFKIRTGDISPRVMELVSGKNIKPAFMNQLISIIEKVRSGVLFRQRVPITHSFTRLKLVPVGNKNKFKLVDFGDIELKMQTMHNIFYTIFLLCEDGIRLQYINDHFNTVKKVFDYFYLNKSEEYIEESVKKYCSKEYNNLINSNISHINETIELALPQNIRDEYRIQKGKGDRYRVLLNRELVDLSNVF